MKNRFLLGIPLGIMCALPVAAQQAASNQESQPIYNVTVVERATKAINYEYRTGPTKIDFRGTVLLPQGKGEASVESLRGRTEIDARFENVTSPSRYGREYLTYTLWAITPEGAARNLGEIVANGANKASLHVTTDLQAFGLIVTAEPYSAARQPSDVVVLENAVRADTIGKIQPIEVKYELMPRGHYTLDLNSSLQRAAADAPKVSMGKYEELLEVYEAQNAIAIARAAGADQYAASTIQKAQMLLGEAQQLQQSKSNTSMVVQDAREASETAEDARAIAERRQQEEKLSAAQHKAARAEEAQAQAQADLRNARVQADAERARADTERVARQQAEADAAAARLQAEQAEVTARPAGPAPAPQVQEAPAQKNELRTQLLGQLNAVLPTLDTPRGLVATVGDTAFNGSDLRDGLAGQVARLAAIVASHPGLRVAVEGFSDEAGSETLAATRAEAVGRILVSQGVPSDAVSSRGLGDSRPLVSNSSPAHREQNRRVEIVISGQPIGNLASWDRTYSATPGDMKSDKRN
jgi:outer membrane protein OmpA-like peptidoglycan-associated protein